MSLCPRCETEIDSAHTGDLCPRCGMRLSARRRSLSGFSLPTATPQGASPSTRPTAPPPRHDAAEDSWGVSDLPPPPAPSSPPAPSAAPKGLGLGPFRAPTHVAPRGDSAQAGDAPYQRPHEDAPREVGTSTMLLAPQAPPAMPGADSKRTSVGVGPGEERAGGDLRRTAVGIGARTLLQAAPPSDVKRTLVQAAPPSDVKRTLVQAALPPIAAPAQPSPSRQTLVMGPTAAAVITATPKAPASFSPSAEPERPTRPQEAPRGGGPVAASSMGAAPSERPGKATLVMTSSPLARPAAEPPARPAPPPAPRDTLGTRRRLDVGPPARKLPLPAPSADEAPAIPALPPVPESITDRTLPADLDDAGPTEVMHAADVPFARTDALSAHDTVDPLGVTQPVEDLLAAAATAPIEPATQPIEAPPAPAFHPAEPPRPAPLSRPEEARVAALVSPRATSVRPTRPAPHDGAWRRLRVVSLVAGALLCLVPWLAPLPTAERSPAVAAGVLGLLVGLAPLARALRGALAVSLGSLLLGAFLVTATDLSPLGLGLTGALLLVLPGALLYRRDDPSAPAGRALSALGLAIGAVWVLSPSAGDLVHLRFPPSGARDFAAIALVPWLLLGLLSLPRRTAAVGGGLFAAGTLIWSCALGMLRSDALALPSAERWRIVAVHGVALASIAALVAAGAASALSAADETRDT